MKTKHKKLVKKTPHLVALSLVLVFSCASVAGALHLMQTAQTYTSDPLPITGSKTVTTSETAQPKGGAATTPIPDQPTTAAPSRTPGDPTTAPSSPTPATPMSTPVTTPAPTASTPTSPTPSAPSEIASESTCPGQADVSKVAIVLVCMTTQARAYHGITGVGPNSQLMDAAAAKAQDMADCSFSHTACSRDFGYWIQQKGYSAGCYAENIAMGQQSPGEVFIAWMNSQGHKDNILHASYKDIGVAYLANDGNPIWVMHLGGC